MDNDIADRAETATSSGRDDHAITPRRPLPLAASALDVPLDRDVFLRTLLRELAGVLQNVVGLEEASGFVSIVGQNMGRQIDHDYRAALGIPRLSREQVAQVLVDLKARIQGDFYIVEQDDDRIVLGNRACPFAEKVIGRPALCMMTSNVFGSIVAENLGYAKVELGETIAMGHPGCRVTVHLRPTDEADAASGREYFGGESAEQ
ncbi:MAG TPA: methanogen output domain 1-containing protein [Gemmatimonadaceae bacterium]